MNALVPDFDEVARDFEGRGRSNGSRTWSARDFMQILGYESWAAFDQAVNKAIGTCITLKIPVNENFEQVPGRPEPDYKLSRFACYLVSMNGDTRKEGVAKAQAYFASVAQAFQDQIHALDAVQRVQIREEITDHERALSGAARAAGVTEYPLFQNAGYRGMYNMDLSKLKDMKGLKDKGRTLLDFMGKRELAGNLFRITETEAKLKHDRIRGQVPAEQAAESVGRRVRAMMVETTGTSPEFLKLGSDVAKVRSGLKAAHREMKKLDKPKARKK